MEGTDNLLPCCGELGDEVCLFHGPGVVPHGLIVGCVDVSLTDGAGDGHTAGLALYGAGHGGVLVCRADREDGLLDKGRFLQAVSSIVCNA